MCGITGFIDYRNISTKDILVKMTDSMRHRGPDGSGYYFEVRERFSIGLGHRRLSIIDLSEAGTQPMRFKNYVLVYNGEVYNFQEIRKRLIANGRKFTSNSDSEVILQAYDEWGKECVKEFIGMFVFVIYDELSNNIFFARDRAGVKPLFWYFSDGLFLFASELKAICAHSSFPKKLNHSAVSTFMQFGYVPTPHCIFENVYKLEPGHLLNFEVDKQKPKIEKYWELLDAYNQPKLRITLNDAIGETEKILEKAFKYRMIADVPVGVFLSGGYDSTCLTALLQKNSGKKLNTFTIGVHQKGLNEAEFAKNTAAYLGTNHTELYCEPSDALKLVPQIPFFFDEPFGDSSAIPTMLVSSLARQHVTVALSADGGDEAFAGYNKYYFGTIQKKKIDKVPSFLRKSIAAVLQKIPAHKIPYFSRKTLFTTRYKKIMHLVGDNNLHELMVNMSSLYMPKELDRLFIERPSISSSYFEQRLESEFYDDLSYMLAMDYKTYMLDDILQKVDRATMSASLEGREPFLDHNIIEFVAKLPSDYKMHQGVKKYILKQIVHKYVPQQMMERPKMGFGIPIASWLKNELKHFVEEATDPAFIQRQGLFRMEEVNQMKQQFFAGKEQLYTKVWYYLMFQLWYKQWM